MSAGSIGLLSLRRGARGLWNLGSQRQSKSCKCIARQAHYCAATPRSSLTRIPIVWTYAGSGLLRRQQVAAAFPANCYSTTTHIPTQLKVESDINSADYDGIVLVSGTAPGEQEPEPFKSLLSSSAQIDSGLFDQGGVLPINLPAKRLIYSPTGSFDISYNDVRVYSEAAVKGIKRALQAGVKSPLLVLLPDSRFENTELVTLLGALEALYVPLEVREIAEDRSHKAKSLGVWSPISSGKLEGLVKLASALESGRYVARDLGGSDPERMAPIKIEEYIRDLFSGTNIKLEVISDPDILLKEYPLFAAVNRAASVIPRHAGRIVFLTYEPSDPACVQDTVMLVGKGVTMDTGGLDIKTGGIMIGMSRDKCGAASVTGFMQTVNLLQPSNVKVVAAVGLVRNSCGENAYVVDEVITARSGARVRVCNTDAEGRFIMADILNQMKEMALTEVNPHLFTIATLTGHAQVCAGTGYSIAMDNSVAKMISNAYTLQACGEALADPFEVSVIRREDIEGHKGKAEGDDVIQSALKRGMRSERGHQKAGAFLMLASGLNKHDTISDKPLKYTHLDIAGSATEPPKTANAVTICALAKRFLGKVFEDNLTETK